ncbi:MAG: tetratricopeptide repeat protein [Candidatus Tectomicrobia bacterium]|uniref:Tetratricopeptide repeat protein n=1 Tax=Tectimicrobiota bacterium TaxID=2528274 RepID=A0A932FVZ8_UNCTE|nr:tetratricopeptide repeat protein [Candidatus Tectomicrobia bacterium]
MALFQKAVELDPNAVEAHLQLGFLYLYLFLQEPQKAISMARTVLEKRPDL